MSAPSSHQPARTRALLLATTALAVITHPALGQEASKSDQLPEVTVQQSGTKKAAAKKSASNKPKPKPVEAAPAVVAETPQNSVAQSPSTELGFYNPATDIEGLQVPPGTTVTTAGPVYGYQALSAMSSTKTATPIEQIPQSIQVVPRSVVEDQQSVTVTEALRNVSNVQGPNTRSIADTQLYPVKLRGFGAEQWLDGLPVVYNAGDRDAFAHVERIEVLKGPSAILYGGGAGAPIGGAVNVISKLPTDIASAEAGIKIGSHDFVQPFFDINQPISPFVLFRLTGEYTTTESSIDVLEQDRYSFNPTLTLTDRSDTSLTLQGRVSRSEQQTYQGLPAFGTVAGNFRIDPDLFIGPSDIPRSHSEVQSITVTLDHRFNETFSANVEARYSRSESDQKTQVLVSADGSGATPLIGPSTWALANSQLTQEQEEFIINPNLQARYNLGPLRNTFLIGGDYSRIEDKGKFTADYLGNACAAFLGTTTFLGFPLCSINAASLVDLQNPAFKIPYSDPAGQYFDTTSPIALPPPFGLGPIAQVATFSDASSTYTTKGVYGQVQSTLYDTVHLLGGVRLASLEIDYFDNAFVTQKRFETDETKVLPRVGAVVDIFNGLSVYAGYSEGMKGVPYSGRFPEPKPEYSDQYDVGIKFNLGSKLSGTLSYFEINRQNVPASTGLGTGVLTNQKSTGYEADVVWQPTQNWQVIASYGHTDAVFEDEFRANILPADDFGTTVILAQKGNKIPGVPEDSGRLWVNYAFDDAILKGWSVGAGIYAAAGSYVDNANLFKTDAYFTVDASIAYADENLRAAFNVKNLTQEEYFVPYSFLGGQVAAGDDRSYYGTIALKY